MSAAADSPERVLPAERYKWPRLGWLAVVAVAVGLGLYVFGGSNEVTAIRVKATGLAIPNFMNAPDFYVELILKDGTTQDTAAYTDIPIGGGLTFDLADPVSLSDIAQVVLYDDDPVKDDMLDRADVNGQNCDGQSYSFEFIGSRTHIAVVGIVILIAGGLYLVYALIAFIHAHAL